MKQEITFCMIKPDATCRQLIGAIVHQLEKEGLKLLRARLTKMSTELCHTFYKEHQDKDFFSSLIQYIISGPVFVMALSGPEAVAHVRKIIGHTDPAKAKKGTIRALYGESIEKNCVHASDSLGNAARELAIFFKDLSIE